MKIADFLTNPCFEWTFEEDNFLLQKMQSQNYFYKWAKIARHLNKTFSLSKQKKNAKQVKRRWQNVIFPAMRQVWSRQEASKFCQLLQIHDPCNKKTWQILKNEFPKYSFKMLKYKYKQLQAMQQQEFIQLHKGQSKQEVAKLDPLQVLCNNLSLC